MREIKFRVWDKINKIMYKKAMVGNFPDTVPVVWTNYGCQEEWYHIEPKECEVMQYTGLKDTDGKEIYEGDILQIEDDICFVEFEDYGFGVTSKEYDEYCLFGEDEELNTYAIKVIGNIYENPELLEGN